MSKTYNTLTYSTKTYQPPCRKYAREYPNNCQIPIGPQIQYMQKPKNSVYSNNPSNLSSNLEEGYVCEPKEGKVVKKEKLNKAVDKSAQSKPKPSSSEKGVELNYEETMQYMSTGNPHVWGPPAWFFFHSGAAHYPLNPSQIWRQRQKQFIQGIPVMLPCENCMKHATAFIESYTSQQLDKVVSSRDNLFRFFVDFHNAVNHRLKKGTMSLEDAWKLYDGTATVTKLSFSSPK